MNQNDFLLLNAGVVILVVVYLAVTRRRPPEPVRLRLHQRDQERDGARDTTAAKVPMTADAAAQPKGATGARYAPPRTPDGVRASTERVLTIAFDYDGRSFDAFEVLQIPAGSSAQSAQIAYTTLVQVTEPEQMPLLQAAYAAIKNTAKS